MADNKKKLASPVSAAREGAVGDGTFPGGPGGPRFRVDASLSRPENILTSDHVLWSAIRNRTDALSSDNYIDFITRVLCEDQDPGDPVCESDCETDGKLPRQAARAKHDLLSLPSIYGVDAYNLLKLATQAFLLFETGVAIQPPRGSTLGD